MGRLSLGPMHLPERVLDPPPWWVPLLCVCVCWWGGENLRVCMWMERRLDFLETGGCAGIV